VLKIGVIKSGVKINGEYAGGVWAPPYRVNITQWLKEGENTVEIEVANTWVNRLTGDAYLPEDQRMVGCLPYPWSPTPAPKLQESGLIGKVRIVIN
jgi:hypothetical protein